MRRHSITKPPTSPKYSDAQPLGTCFLLCSGQFYPYPSGLLHWHWGNHVIAPVPVKQPWRICKIDPKNLLRTDNRTKTKCHTTRSCAYVIGHNVYMGFSSTLIMLFIISCQAHMNFINCLLNIQLSKKYPHIKQATPFYQMKSYDSQWPGDKWRHGLCGHKPISLGIYSLTSITKVNVTWSVSHVTKIFLIIGQVKTGLCFSTSKG